MIARFLTRFLFILEVYLHRQRLKNWNSMTLLYLERINMAPGFVRLLGRKSLSQLLESNIQTTNTQFLYFKN